MSNLAEVSVKLPSGEEFIVTGSVQQVSKHYPKRSSGYLAQQETFRKNWQEEALRSFCNALEEEIDGTYYEEDILWIINELMEIRGYYPIKKVTMYE